MTFAHRDWAEVVRAANRCQHLIGRRYGEHRLKIIRGFDVAAFDHDRQTSKPTMWGVKPRWSYSKDSPIVTRDEGFVKFNLGKPSIGHLN